jgi:hypothetical protein
VNRWIKGEIEKVRHVEGRVGGDATVDALLERQTLNKNRGGAL